ncbi:hypothetical protein DU508_18330 [Pedobacter chinensis]|uniref:DUF3251 domain-containing protein n=1 Tax=Pedobacter chinensis TaxID=2282421 RepID=A0A369PWP1_9SPHI|nr:hypothetical protein [Pedobacter chinensis]RDC55109.1 hypothetical protein DU508_18330 [Pedobacter chinensis]
MKKFLFLLLLSGQIGFAQTNLQALKEENNKLKSQNQTLQDELTTLKKQNDYFRETLKIFEEKIKTISNSKIDCTMLSCEGNKQDQTVKLQFLLTNNDIKKNLLFSPDSYGKAIDLQGNTLKANNIIFGPNKYAADLETDIPTKLTIVFPGILPSTALLKMIELKCTTTNDFKNLNFVFKDISIIWK